jgi:hypothetical protein
LSHGCNLRGQIVKARIVAQPSLLEFIGNFSAKRLLLVRLLCQLLRLMHEELMNGELLLTDDSSNQGCKVHSSEAGQSSLCQKQLCLSSCESSCASAASISQASHSQCRGPALIGATSDDMHAAIVILGV